MANALFTESQHVYDLTIDPRHPDTLYICGFDAAAYRSTDRGAHWERIKGYDFKWGHRVILDPNDPHDLHHYVRRRSLAWTSQRHNGCALDHFDSGSYRPGGTMRVLVNSTSW